MNEKVERTLKVVGAISAPIILYTGIGLTARYLKATEPKSGTGAFYLALCDEDPDACVAWVSGFTAGLAKGYRASGSTDDAMTAKRKMRICFPEEVTISDQTDAFTDYLDKHDDQLDERGSVLIMRSWQEKWPCT